MDGFCLPTQIDHGFAGHWDHNDLIQTNDLILEFSSMSLPSLQNRGQKDKICEHPTRHGKHDGAYRNRIADVLSKKEREHDVAESLC